PLDDDAGELPFYAVVRRDDLLVRAGGLRVEAGRLVFEDHAIPAVGDVWSALQTLARAGVLAIVGKAVPLQIQLRNRVSGGVLLLPRGGAPYGKMVTRFAAALSREKLFPEIRPAHWVDFRILDTLSAWNGQFRLPEYLHAPFGGEAVYGAEFAQ